ncbi:MAG: hypothetical protein EZS28_009940, partial [Streblomastix strix]
MKIFADNASKLQSLENEVPKKARKRNYANDDDARFAIVYKKKIAHAMERQRLLDY